MAHCRSPEAQPQGLRLTTGLGASLPELPLLVLLPLLELVPADLRATLLREETLFVGGPASGVPSSAAPVAGGLAASAGSCVGAAVGVGGTVITGAG
jgi:hypothetical protein